ncbi:MAG: hypothetical protein KDE31_29255 [Caldilineaceae bacterium]|nr:hypothetical protein [Caldilineaceae bacterium]
MNSDAYHAYLLRLRHLDNAGQAQWVITLQEAGSDRERHFADLIALISFLNDRMNDSVRRSKEDYA